MVRLSRFLLYTSLGFSLPCLPQQAYAAKEEVRDVSFWSGDHGKIHVSYTLVGKGAYEVSLIMSDDGGTAFVHLPVSVSGDVGAGVRAGPDKRIIWDALKDVGQLEGDSFVFKVRAIRHLDFGKWPWVIGAGAVGAAAAWAISGTEEEEGKIVIEVQDPEKQE